MFNNLENKRLFWCKESNLLALTIFLNAKLTFSVYFKAACELAKVNYSLNKSSYLYDIA